LIETTRNGDVLVLRMAHGKASALDTEFLEALARAFEGAVHDDARAVVLTGTGSIFSAGVDLPRLSAGGREYLETFLPALSGAFLALFTLPKPVVAAINGHAIAGGCVLACACDRRLMAKGSGRIGVSEVLVGVPFPMLALEIMRFAVPPQRLPDLALTGRTVAPQEALELGLVDQLVPVETLERAAIEAATKMAAVPARAFHMTKIALRHPVLDRWRRDGPRADAEVFEAWAAADTQAAIRDFVKRTFEKPPRSNG